MTLCPKVDSFAARIPAEETGSYVMTLVDGYFVTNEAIALFSVGLRIVCVRILIPRAEANLELTSLSSSAQVAISPPMLGFLIRLTS